MNRPLIFAVLLLQTSLQLGVTVNLVQAEQSPGSSAAGSAKIGESVIGKDGKKLAEDKSKEKGNKDKEKGNGKKDDANNSADKNSAAGPKIDEKNWDEYLKQSKQLYAEGKLNESFNDLELALSAAERLKSDGGKAEAFLAIGEQYLYLKKYEKAKALMEEGLKQKRRIPGFKTVSSANVLDNLAQAYSRTGDLESAKKFQQEALASYESMEKTETHDYAIALSNHANTLRQLKQYKESEQFFSKAVAVQRKVDGSKGDSDEMAKILLNAGGLYCEMNKLDSAKRLLDRASKIIRSTYKPEHPLYLLSVKSERVYYKKLVESLLKNDQNAYRPEVAQAVLRLASLYESEDDNAQACAAYKQAISIQEKLSPQGSPELDKTKESYARCMKKLSN